MITKQKRTRIVNDDICVSRTCDLCGRVGSPITNWDSPPRRYGGRNTIDECVVRINSGFDDPDGSGVIGRKDMVFDICPDCFRSVLIPFLGSKGAAPRTEDYDPAHD